MKFTKGTSFPSETGVTYVEFWYSTFHFGSEVRKKSAKWFSTLVDPAEPGRRGMRMGDRIGPSWISKSFPGRGSDFKVASETS